MDRKCSAIILPAVSTCYLSSDSSKVSPQCYFPESLVPLFEKQFWVSDRAISFRFWGNQVSFGSVHVSTSQAIVVLFLEETNLSHSHREVNPPPLPIPFLWFCTVKSRWKRVSCVWFCGGGTCCSVNCLSNGCDGLFVFARKRLFFFFTKEACSWPSGLPSSRPFWCGGKKAEKKEY